jgi:hypothetical protein
MAAPNALPPPAPLLALPATVQSLGPEPGHVGLPHATHRPAWAVVKEFLGRHPILCLTLLSPGIPEYLSSSSALTTILVSPAFFLLQLALNVGLYLPGVLLIREAMVRWKKGWGSVLLLGAAYGILEEGIALETLFYSRAGPVGVEGFYGHWLGVSWVWTVGVLAVHMIFSISLPILLLGLALPQTRGKSLVGRRGLAYAFLVWAIDIPVLMLIVHATYHYWMGWPIFFGSFAVIGVLVLAAYRVPATLLPTRSGPPRVSTFQAALMGVAFFPPIWVFEAVLGYWRVLPAVTIAVIVAYEAGLAYLVVRTLGTVDNERHLVAFAAGIIATIGFIGFVAEFPIPLTIFADLAAFWFLRHLWKKYSPTGPAVSVPVPPGAYAFG